ncbi:uncharacterized protein Z518_08815 [Rhinocladiella mackenziei CBS 650.93]|uniref:Archaemetzincin-2 n=1 Tax=Rhinocladiella mackenziei CBS 650.93 TaxID=1442369 RepID=A0A0D2FLJ8_9EURO|nr:uncharacterized protein Z518_08815 [Rhinocladiella mackenziei CBS 650.93]KIX02872.1 hypothetical protein Z518_08815 [Rhinocladiella mackenziei CBS 650.93]
MPSSGAQPAPPNREKCKHDSLTFSPSNHAVTWGYSPYTNQQILTAITGKRKHSPRAAFSHHLDIFPAPLVLPGDEIDVDPTCPPQSFRSWVNLGVRNHVTSRRNVIYVAVSPEIDPSVGYMREWCRPKVDSSMNSKTPIQSTLDISSVVAYLQAFYHGLEVKLFPTKLTFTSWTHSPGHRPTRSQKTPSKGHSGVEYVALSTQRELVRIRVRSRAPLDSVSPPHLFPYTHQLNLSDLTDGAISILPSDAYALLLTTVHDIYESDDDDFCCGRAWGASRVAIVSSARYDPALDKLHAVDEDHVWPASHCKTFVEEMSRENLDGEGLDRVEKRRKITKSATAAYSLSLQKALKAHMTSVNVPPLSPLDISSANLFRLCRTASHELGHCLGLDHCMYKACLMQGAASVAEDLRQPPYLCPICERKVGWAVWGRDMARSMPKAKVGKTKGKNKRTLNREMDNSDWERKFSNWKLDRCLAMKRFCEGQGGSFAVFAAWLEDMLEVTGTRSGGSDL